MMEEGFSTHLLDAVLESKRRKREAARKEMLEKVLSLLDRLAQRIDFKEAFVFGSLVKPGRFVPGISDVDIALGGLRDEDFFPAAAFLSSELGIDVDLIQLEKHPLAQAIREEGVRWKRRV